MAKPKVFVFAPADQTGESHRRLEDAGCTLSLGKANWHTPQGDNEAEICALAQGAAALCGTSIRSSPISRRVIGTSPNLRIIAKFTIGVDDVDVDAATELGILVTHSPTESNWSGVAEGTMAMMLGILKKSRERDAAMKRGEWRDPALEGTFLGRRQDGYPGITVGILGLGRIGSRLADLLAPWRVRLIACDPYIGPDKFVHHDVERVDIETLFREADVVSCHVNLTKETQGMVNADLFSLMKPTAVFLNAARGKIVAEGDLIDALLNDRIAGAALDVYEDEPLPPQSALLGLGDKVMLSAHMVSSNRFSGLKPGVEWSIRSILTALNGEVPDNVYNKEVIGKWQERFGGRSLLK